MLLGNKTADEIETFGGSQEAWGNPFLFDLKNKCRQNKRFFNDLNIPLCTLYASSLGMLQDLLWRWFLGFSVSRFLGFSHRNLVSRCKYGWAQCMPPMRMAQNLAIGFFIDHVVMRVMCLVELRRPDCDAQNSMSNHARTYLGKMPCIGV